MKFLAKLLAIAIILSISHHLFAQDDDDDEIKMTQKEWHLKRDQYAVSAITLLERMETLNAEIDSLKQLNDSSANVISGCEDALYGLVGATKQEVAQFRIRFDETEKRLLQKSFAPGDVEKTYYAEIAGSRIRCLPEFADRYETMKNKIDNFTEAPVKETRENNYVVAEGDNLWIIAVRKYGTPRMWRVIWEANKLQIKKRSAFDEKYFDEIMNPNIIFPGQVLTLPSSDK